MPEQGKKKDLPKVFGPVVYIVSNLVILRLCLVRSRRYIVFRDAAARGHHHHTGLVETFLFLVGMFLTVV